jgi:putative Mg2+ transporter-C (MgtC) family protein
MPSILGHGRAPGQINEMQPVLVVRSLTTEQSGRQDNTVEFHLPVLEVLLRLLAAAGMGAAIGWERQMREKAAGLRTHMLVSLGCASFTVVTLEMIRLSPGPVYDPADPARVVQGVLTGIGFLGAGAIFRAGDRPRGLTTAAGIWTIGAVGVACGLGAYWIAGLTVLIALVIIIGMAWVERRFLAERAESRRVLPS